MSGHSFEFRRAHRRFPIALAVVLLALGAVAQRSLIAPPASAAVMTALQEPAPVSQSRYEYRAVHDPNGTGKFYMGREIAQVMGAGGISWLDRLGRATEEHPEVVIDTLRLHQGEVVADLGAGSGYFTFRIAPQVGTTGEVLAVDIQDEMVETLRRRAAELHATNVEVVQATETDPHLPAGTVDMVLAVDVYHELAWPFEVMTKVHDALKPGGRVVFVEYRKEDPRVPIKELHKMSVAQLEKEMHVARLKRVQTVETLPWQHIVIFERQD